MLIANASTINFSALEKDIKRDLRYADIPLPFYMNLFPRFPKSPEIINTRASIRVIFGAGPHWGPEKKRRLEQAYNGGIFKTLRPFPENYFKRPLSPLERVASAVHEVMHHIDLSKRWADGVVGAVKEMPQDPKVKALFIGNIAERIADVGATLYLLSNVSDLKCAGWVVQKRADDRRLCADATHYTVDSIESAAAWFQTRPTQGLGIYEAALFARQIVAAQAHEIVDRFPTVVKASDFVARGRAAERDVPRVAKLVQDAFRARGRLLARL
ncbi:MAG TPA: hypothetical protein DCY07_03605 [Rhodospirillaceae bacterium]|nr:hypothetical protein [Rhodospirillaceae bacterium]